MGKINYPECYTLWYTKHIGFFWHNTTIIRPFRLYFRLHLSKTNWAVCVPLIKVILICEGLLVCIADPSFLREMEWTSAMLIRVALGWVIDVHFGTWHWFSWCIFYLTQSHSIKFLKKISGTFNEHVWCMIGAQKFNISKEEISNSTFIRPLP